MIEVITTKIAAFKRDFFGAPIRRALLAVKNNWPINPCMIPYRKDEKYWITDPGDGGASFYISFHFDNP